MAEHIEKGYERRGTPKKIAEARAWATVNKETGGAGKPIQSTASSRKGGKIGGKRSHGGRGKAASSR